MQDLPSTWQVEETSARPVEPLADVRGEVEAQLANPLASLPLEDVCGPGTKVTIVCDEAPTRGTRAMLLRGVLSQLERAGVDPKQVTVLIAAWRANEMTQAPPSPPTLGPGYAVRVHVVVHNPNDLRQLDELGTYEGVPMAVNYHAAEADLLIAISVMQLNNDAFDTGSAGTITSALMSALTMRELRTTRFLDDHAEPALDARPLFAQVVREGARRTGLVFAVDAIVDADECALAVRAGAPNAVNDALMQIAAELREAHVTSSSYDVMLADAGHDARPGLFDASRAAINIGLARNPVLMRGGSLIIPTGLGMGSGRDNDTLDGYDEDADEDARSFYDALTNAATPDLVIQQLQGRSLTHGEERAYLLAHVMQRHRVIAAGPHRDQLARASHFLSASDVRDAAELAESFGERSPRALIVHNANLSIPTFSGAYWGSELLDDELAELMRN